MGGGQARRLCPARRGGPAPHLGLRRGQPGRVRGVRRHHAAGRGAVHRRGLPRRRRPAAGCRARRRRSRPGSARDVRDQVGLPITVGVARTKFLAKVASGGGQARRPAGGAARRRAGLPAPAAGRAAVGRRAPSPRPSSTTGASRTVGQVARLAEAALVAMLGPGVGPPPPRPGPQPRSAAGAGRVGGGARSGRSAPSAGRAARPGRSTRCWWAWSTGSPAACAPPTGWGARSCCACASTTSRRATRSHTLTRATAQTHPILAHGPRPARRGPAAHRRTGPDAGGRGGRQPRRRPRRPAGPALRPGAATGRSTARSTRCASGSVRPRSPGPCCSASTRACRCRCCPTDRRAGGARPCGARAAAAHLVWP